MIKLRAYRFEYSRICANLLRILSVVQYLRGTKYLSLRMGAILTFLLCFVYETGERTNGQNVSF